MQNENDLGFFWSKFDSFGKEQDQICMLGFQKKKKTNKDKVWRYNHANNMPTLAHHTQKLYSTNTNIIKP